MKTNKHIQHNQHVALALNELLFPHRLVFQVLESVNEKSGQAVLLGEILAALTKDQTSAV